MVPNKRRLLDLIVALAQAPNPERFSMKYFLWRGQSYKGWCGTPACVLGHYGSRPDLQTLIEVRKDVKKDPYLGYTAENERILNEAVCIDDDQLQEWFGMDSTQCCDMFDTNGCDGAQTAEAAISYIAHFIMENCE